MALFPTATCTSGKRAFCHCCLCLYVLLNTTSSVSCDDEEFVIAGYLPEYRSYINVNKTAPYLTDLILFSLEPDDRGNLGPCCLEPHHFDQVREARASKLENFPEKKPLKVWLSIGGAGRSNSFSKIAADSNLRKTFVQGLKKMCQREQIDGIDFDWEAPRTQEDYKNYHKLVQEAHNELLLKNGILMSVALHPHQNFFPRLFYDHVSRINLMTYDMLTTREGGGGHHASMGSMTNAIDALAGGGCPRSKIVVGIPAYARHGKNPGLVQTYSEIVDAILRKTPHVDKTTALQKPSFRGFLFDSPRTVREKVSHAVKNGHAGIFFWELGQDKQHDEWGPGGLLLEAAAHQVGLESTRTASTTSGEL